MGNVMSIGRSKAKTYTADKPGTTFADVAGYEGVKQEITEVVDFLQDAGPVQGDRRPHPQGHPARGPPGTGKTLIARAVAGEAGVPFLSVTGSDFMEMFVGVGASRVRDLFQQARKMGRAIIFVDEIDSIGRKRGAGLGGGHDEREQTLNQMLAEMDGFETTEGIVMMAATNRPDILDPALLRPGRFDRQVVVPLPEYEERLAILKVHCKTSSSAPTSTSRPWPRARPGMSGADLANLVNEAALFAVRRGRRDRAHRLRERPRPGHHGRPPREPGALPRGEEHSPPTTRVATPCWPPCSPTPTPCTRSRSSPPAWPWASPRAARGAPQLQPGLHRGPALHGPRRPGGRGARLRPACPPARPTTWSRPPSWARGW
jgi:SpoVK/Ycf46/Vps4 family AAA+-type ATPase